MHLYTCINNTHKQFSLNCFHYLNIKITSFHEYSCVEAKIKKLFVSHTWPTVATGNIFWGDLTMFFFLYFGYRKSWPEVSDTVPEFTFGTGLHCFIWSTSIAQPGQEPELCHMNAELKLRYCKCDVKWRVGQAPARNQFFLYQFQGTTKMCAQNIKFSKFYWFQCQSSVLLIRK